MIKPAISIRGSVTSTVNVQGKINAGVIKEHPELENLTVTPSIEEQKFKSEKYGYDEVVIEKVTADIDPSIKSENIKEGETILGVPGGYKGIDTSDADATEIDIASGKTAYVNGEKITGTYEQLDTSDADATSDDICMGKTAYVNGEKITGKVFEAGITTMSTSNVTDTNYSVDVKSIMNQDYLFRKNGSLTYSVSYKNMANAIGLTPEKLVEGNTVIGVAGTQKALDTSDADATANDICMGKTAYVNGEKITGKVFEAGQTSMMTSDIEVNDSRINITKVMPQDYLFRKNGSITYNVKHADMSKAIGLTPEKIVEGNTIIGVSGTQKILDTSDADATAADIMKDKTAYVNGVKVVGTHEDTASEGEYNAIVTPNGTTFSVKNAFSEMGDLDLTGIKGLTEAFKDFINLKKIKSISNTSDLTSLYYAFSGCTSLEEIPNFDTQNVTDMRNTFYGCSVLTKIPNFNTSKVTKMSYTFSNCKKLEEIPYLETSNVTDMSYMFQYAQSIKTIPQLDMSKVTTAYYMFNYASKLETIPLLDFSKITNMISMFDQCPRLQSVPLLDTSSATNMNRIFCNCTSLTEVPQLNTSKVIDFGSVFLSCSSLHTIPELDASKMNNINSTFDNCTKLANFGGLLNIGQNYTQKSANYYNYTFRLSSCNSLTHESLMNIINRLYDLNLRYDVANGGTLYTQKLQIGSTNLAKLTSEEIAIATNKGWTVS